MKPVERRTATLSYLHSIKPGHRNPGFFYAYYWVSEKTSSRQFGE
jgi:hypothetical protein